MASAHSLTEVNILRKFIENLAKGSGYGVYANAKLKHVTFNCDLDLGRHG